jgi:hypothetical protein
MEIILLALFIYASEMRMHFFNRQHKKSKVYMGNIKMRKITKLD